jgi:hypothetical protein
MDNLRIGDYAFDSELAWAWGEKIVTALVILVITWILAKAAKWAFAKLVDNISFLQRDTSSGQSVGASLGQIVSLLIWLFGLLAILQTFELGGVMTPIENLLNTIMGFLPNVIGAGIIFFVGTIVANIVRDIVVTSLQTVDFDKWVNRGGVESVTGNSQISKTIGTIIWVLVIIPIAIGALNVLQIEAISTPASNMLAMILAAIPNIIAASVLLGIGYFISRFVVQILGEVLPGLGVDQSVAAMGVLPAGTNVSSVVARVAQIAIMLFFAIAAMRLLNFPELTAILNNILELGGRVVFGAVVIAVGFMVANVLARIVGGTSENSSLASVVRYAALLLFAFMGLQYMGVGDEIVQTAFTAIVAAAAVAAALAFGLGGRDWAAKTLEKMDKSGDE